MTHIIDGRKCKVDGSTKRYLKSNSCVLCQRNRTIKYIRGLKNGRPNNRAVIEIYSAGIKHVIPAPKQTLINMAW